MPYRANWLQRRVRRMACSWPFWSYVSSPMPRSFGRIQVEQDRKRLLQVGRPPHRRRQFACKACPKTTFQALTRGSLNYRWPIARCQHSVSKTALGLETLCYTARSAIEFVDAKLRSSDQVVWPGHAFNAWNVIFGHALQSEIGCSDEEDRGLGEPVFRLLRFDLPDQSCGALGRT